MVKINCIDVVSETTSILWKQGLLPLNSLHKFQIKKLIIHSIIHIYVVSVMILNIMNGINGGNTMLSYRIVCILIPEINLLAKVLTLLKNKKYFIFILEDLKSDGFNMHSTQLNEHVRLVYKISRLMFRYFVITMGLFILIAAVLPLIINMKMLIPNPLVSGRFEFRYRVSHLFFAIYMATNSTCLDVLYASLIGLCIAQLNILETRLINIFRSSKKPRTSESLKLKHAAVGKRLRECIILHEMINSFVAKLSVLLSLPLFIQYAGGCFIICNVILQITIMGERGTFNIIILITYTGVTFSQMTFYHWLGNEIIFKSNKIAESCYLSKWYEMDKYSKTSLLVLMERAKRPLDIQVYKLISISIESLAVIIRWSYSLFAVIKARYSQK